MATPKLLAAARSSPGQTRVFIPPSRLRRLSLTGIDRFVERYTELPGLRLIALTFKVNRRADRDLLRGYHVDPTPAASMTGHEVIAAIAL